MGWEFINSNNPVEEFSRLNNVQKMSSVPEWTGGSEVLEDLWAEACGYDIPAALLRKEATTRTFVNTKRKSHGKRKHHLIHYSPPHHLFPSIVILYYLNCDLVNFNP